MNPGCDHSKIGPADAIEEGKHCAFKECPNYREKCPKHTVVISRRSSFCNLDESQQVDNLCKILQRIWNRFDGAETIVQAIDLGLGAERAKLVLAALHARDLSSDKIGGSDDMP